MSLEQVIAENTATMRELIVVIQSMGARAALVGTAGSTPADDNKVKKATYFHLVDKKQVVKIDAGGERPIGGLEVTAAEAKKLDEKYKADAAKNDTQTGAAGGQTQGTGGSSSATGTPSDSPSFADVTAKITEMSKTDGGREKVLAIFKQWGVEKFPQVQGKKPNAELIADIVNMMAPPKQESSGLDDLGL